MAFPLKDVRYQTRRAREEGPGDGVAETRTIYPRLLRDRAVLPKVDIAVEYFESLVGRERREFDAEVLVQFFGDHKLARCVVAALATSYRYRSPEIAEVTSPTARRRLLRAGVDSPRALRAYLYDGLNGASAGLSADGFMRREEQGAVYGRLEQAFGLRQGQAERLLYLDADEHALLRRSGPPPAPADVVAQYNFGVLETLLRHAATVELTLADPGDDTWPGAPAALRALCAANDVDAHLSARGPGRLELRLTGRADALGSWARQGRRLARTVVQVLERAGRGVVDGWADVSLRERRAVLRLTPEVLDALGAVAGPGAPARVERAPGPPAKSLAPLARLGRGGEQRATRAGVSMGAPSAGWADLPGWDAPALAASLAAGRGGRPRASAGGDGAGSHPDQAGQGEVGGPPPRRRAGRGALSAGWGVRRLPEAQAWASGVLIPEVRFVRGSEAVRLCAVRSARHGVRLAAIARGAPSGEPLLFAGHPEAVAPLADAGVPVVALPALDLSTVLAALPGDPLPGEPAPPPRARRPQREARRLDPVFS